MAAVGAAFSERKEEVERIAVIQCSSPQGSMLSPALLSVEETLHSAQQWKRRWRLGDTSKKTISLVDPGHSQEGAAATALAAVLAQPRDIYVPPQFGSWPVLFFIFSFKETPAEGTRETPTVSFSRS